MRLHRLEIEAFGPFGGHESVDFDALSDSGLFLLSGPTGAGKTSVLDAVCFALFGEVPGARGDAARLASDHRDPDATPRVTLEATVGGRRIRVVRVPAHERPPKKGAGAPVKDTGSAVLELSDPAADGGWRAVAAKIPEVRRELDPLLGMTAEQFLQVVMLPQGAFATFLRADAKARREVLERLFDAGRFSKIELWLQDRARDARQAVEHQQIAVDNALAEAGGAWGSSGSVGGGESREAAQAGEADGASGTGGAPSLRDGATVEDVDRWLDAERGRLAAERDQANAARDAAQAALTGVERERDAARERAGLQQRRREAEGRLAKIAEDADAHAERVARLQAHRRAAPLRGYLSGVAAARATAADSARTIDKARKWIEQLEDDGLSADPGTWAAGARQRADAIAALGDLVEQEAGLPGRQTELQRLRDAARTAAERVRACEQRLEQVATTEAALEARRVAADAAAATVARLEEQSAAAERRAAAGAERDALVIREEQAVSAAQTAVDTHQRAVDTVQRLRQARLDGYAAELAAGLEAEDACPVCGSVEHPAPASPGDGHVTAAEEQAAVSVADAAQRERDAAEQRVGEIRSALAAARSAASVGGAGAASIGAVRDTDGARDRDQPDEDTASLLRMATELGERLSAARTAADDGARVADERRALAVQQQADREALSDARDAVARLTAQADGLTVELERLQARIDDERRHFPDVAARVRALEHQATFLEKATSAHDADVAARKTLEQAQDALAEALTEHDLTDADQAAAAILTPKDVSALEAEIRRVDEARAAAQGVLATPEIAAVELEPAVDVAAIEARRTAAAEAAEQAASAASACASCADAEATRRDALRAQLDRLGPLREAADRAHALAELARGGVGNQRRIQLSSWVLAARLEQVAAAATAHLLEMSDGRYRLVLHEEPASARGKGNAGLGLRVLDGWTGEQRDTTTLSGGESFFASLSLALGLAETVTAEAGGLDLGTLFIDEGFGSLDEQTLEDVLEQLDKLRDGGRAVGIVSHVPELKQRIPVQLTVEKARDGSRLRQTVGVVGA
ncbi:MAG: SMC family ATPase [Patulibacter sp.]|nr:SMC family ATPase [Patulibacter sp.]